MNTVDDLRLFSRTEQDKTQGESTLERCDELIVQHLGWKRENKQWSNLFQGISVIFTAAIPVILLLPWEYANIVGAAFSAVAGTATGLLAIHGWREPFIRYGYIYHMLQVEKYLYKANATKDYPDTDPIRAARNFAKRIETLVTLDVTEWRTEMQRVEERS